MLILPKGAPRGNKTGCNRSEDFLAIVPSYEVVCPEGAGVLRRRLATVGVVDVDVVVVVDAIVGSSAILGAPCLGQ